MLKRLRYKIWLLCGGRRVESGFKFLSGEIIAGRDRERALSRRISALELQVWDLEKHTPHESLLKAASMMEGYSAAVDSLRTKEPDE